MTKWKNQSTNHGNGKPAIFVWNSNSNIFYSSSLLFALYPETDDGTKPFIAIAMLVCGVIGGLMLVILCLIFCKQCFKPQQDSKLNENRCYYRTCYSEKSSPAKRSRLNNRLFEYATESQSRKSKGNEQQYKNKPCSGNLMVIETSRNVAEFCPKGKSSSEKHIKIAHPDNQTTVEEETSEVLQQHCNEFNHFQCRQALHSPQSRLTIFQNTLSFKDKSNSKMLKNGTELQKCISQSKVNRACSTAPVLPVEKNNEDLLADQFSENDSLIASDWVEQQPRKIYVDRKKRQNILKRAPQPNLCNNHQSAWAEQGGRVIKSFELLDDHCKPYIPTRQARSLEIDYGTTTTSKPIHQSFCFGRQQLNKANPPRLLFNSPAYEKWDNFEANFRTRIARPLTEDLAGKMESECNNKLWELRCSLIKQLHSLNHNMPAKDKMFCRTENDKKSSSSSTTCTTSFESNTELSACDEFSWTPCLPTLNSTPLTLHAKRQKLRLVISDSFYWIALLEAQLTSRPEIWEQAQNRFPYIPPIKNEVIDLTCASLVNDSIGNACQYWIHSESTLPSQTSEHPLIGIQYHPSEQKAGQASHFFLNFLLFIRRFLLAVANKKYTYCLLIDCYNAIRKARIRKKWKPAGQYQFVAEQRLTRRKHGGGSERTCSRERLVTLRACPGNGVEGSHKCLLRPTPSLFSRNESERVAGHGRSLFLRLRCATLPPSRQRSPAYDGSGATLALPARVNTGQFLAEPQTSPAGGLRRERVSDPVGNAFQWLRQRKDQPIRDFAREVAKVGRRAGKSESELVCRFILVLASRELHRGLCLREPATLAKARQWAERVTEIEEGRRSAVDDTGLGNGGLAKTVEALAQRLDKMEVTRERPSRLQPTRRAMECFECGDLGHIRRDCPQLRFRTRSARASSSGTSDGRLLAMTELQAGQSPSVTDRKLERTYTRRSCRESGRTGDLGYELLRPVRQGDRLASPGDDHDGVKIEREPVPNERRSIGCALVRPNFSEAGVGKTTEGKPDRGDGDLEEWGRSLVDGAECYARRLAPTYPDMRIQSAIRSLWVQVSPSRCESVMAREICLVYFKNSGDSIYLDYDSILLLLNVWTQTAPATG
ncbi:hypothetical protein T01_2239 [Trichinella spiralis]|uniref:CCHC-type domain-containing protein n=1 Tax=Trichinella spiralis TaxID=6334 RepID=A0A0V1B2G3_TRISP|nr:hypothetical protein T01_2239 [Trichinella spiralis]